MTGSGPVRFLAVALPGALRSRYDEVGRAAGQQELPPPDQDLSCPTCSGGSRAPRYGLRMVGPPIPADA